MATPTATTTIPNQKLKKERKATDLTQKGSLILSANHPERILVFLLEIAMLRTTTKLSDKGSSIHSPLSEPVTEGFSLLLSEIRLWHDVKLLVRRTHTRSETSLFSLRNSFENIRTANWTKTRS